jgi:membrane fusion protein (multidrug efflux system)
VRIDDKTMNTPLVRALALSALVCSVAACDGGKGKAPPPPPVPEVGVITLQPKPAQLYSELPGRVTATRTAEIRPQVAGILQKRLFTEGSEVKAGQALYQIDADAYRAAVGRTRGVLVSAEAQATNTRAIAQRYQTLFERQLASQQDRDTTRANQLRAEADVVAAKAALDAAQVELDRTRISAPISGRIGRSQVTEGALVRVAQDAPLAVIQQLDTVNVDVTQSSAELLRLQRELASGRLQQDKAVTARVMLTLEDGSAYPEAGELRFSEVTVDAGTGSVLLRASFPNPRRELLPGMFVRARVGQAVATEALLVPQVGVSRNARGLPTVLVIGADDMAEERVLTTGRVIDNQWQVLDGLKAGDRVIVEGLQRAKAGNKVKPVPAGSKPAPVGPPGAPPAAAPPAAPKG